MHPTCQAPVRAARLRHDFLLNRILNKRSGDLLTLRRAGEWSLLEDEWNSYVKEAGDVGRTLRNDCDPAVLVRHISPLSSLGSELVVELEASVARAFAATAEADMLEADGSSIVASSNRLRDEFLKLVAVWRDHDGPAITLAWESLELTARDLLAALYRVPEGYIAP